MCVFVLLFSTQELFIPKNKSKTTLAYCTFGGGFFPYILNVVHGRNINGHSLFTVFCSSQQKKELSYPLFGRNN
jgi:hypothetical protein